MKKILALTLSVIVVATMFTACFSKDENDSSSSSSGTTTTTTETTTVADTAVTTTDNTTVSGDVTETSSVETLAEAILAATEWTAMDTVTDETRLKDYFMLDASNANYEEMIAKQAMMSAAFAEIIIIKAKDGSVDEVVKDLEARKKKMVDTDVFYPSHADIAANAIVGKEGNYVYLLAHEDPKTSEKTLKEEIGKLK